MSKPVNKKTVGIFVVIAIALVVAGVLTLGSGKFFQYRPKYVMYFEGSVKGLQVGSPVVFRGVRIGHVTEIGMLFDQKDLAMRIPVYVELGEADTQMVGPEAKIDKRKFHKEYLKRFIEAGLRAKLEMQSIVTGQLQIALDLYPDKPAKFVALPSKYPELPTIPTDLQQLAKRLEELPFKEILEKLRDVATGIDRMINSPEMTRIVRSLDEGVNETRSLLRDIDAQVKPLGKEIGDTTQEIRKLTAETRNQVQPLATSVRKTSDEAGATLKKAQAALNNIEIMTGDDSQIGHRLLTTLDALERTARSLRILAETMEQQPQSVIFGKPNARRE